MPTDQTGPKVAPPAAVYISAQAEGLAAHDRAIAEGRTEAAEGDALDVMVDVAYAAGVAAGRARETTLARGIFALAELDKHSTDGLPFTPFGSKPGSWCGPCSRFADALLRGVTPADALHLRCPESQGWQRQVDAAIELAKEIADSVGISHSECLNKEDA